MSAGDVVDEAGTELIVLPGTGEALELTAATDRLAGAVVELDELVTRIEDAKAVIKAELAKRLDKGNERKAAIGDFELSVNAPTTELYDVEVLKRELKALVDDDVLEERVIGLVLPLPPAPPPPARELDKRELNKLKKHPDRRVLTAIAKARTVQTNRRTVGVKRKA